MNARLRLWVRLALAFGALLVLLGLTAATGVTQLSALSALDARQAELAQLRQQVGQWSALTRLNVVRTVTLAKAGSPPPLAQWIDGEMKDTSARISELQKKLEASLAGDKDKPLLEAVAQARKKYLALRVSLLKRLALPEQAEQATAEIESQLMPAAAAYLASLDAVMAHVDAESALHEAERQQTLQRAYRVIPALAALALVLGIVLAWRVARSLVLPIRAAQATARRIAAGDLTQPVCTDRADEIGELQQALADMQASLGRMVGGIRAGTDHVSTATTQIASGNQDLSARTERAASSLQQTAATMAQLSEAIQQSAGSADEAHRLATSAAAVARRGGAVVAEVVSTMAEINAGSSRISEITGVIDGIAFQTNILALNAAVEAARAGEQGRGFAVVAAEVRSLAGRCGDAAREIRGLIESSVHKVQAGSRLVENAGSTMRDIEHSVQDVSQAIGGITAAASGQANGIGEVNQAVLQLDQITQQNAALVEESAAAAQSLKEQATALARMVGNFRMSPAGA